METNATAAPRYTGPDTVTTTAVATPRSPPLTSIRPAVRAGDCGRGRLNADTTFASIDATTPRLSESVFDVRSLLVETSDYHWSARHQS